MTTSLGATGGRGGGGRGRRRDRQRESPSFTSFLDPSETHLGENAFFQQRLIFMKLLKSGQTQTSTPHPGLQHSQITSIAMESQLGAQVSPCVRGNRCRGSSPRQRGTSALTPTAWAIYTPTTVHSASQETNTLHPPFQWEWAGGCDPKTSQTCEYQQELPLENGSEGYCIQLYSLHWIMADTGIPSQELSKIN